MLCLHLYVIFLVDQIRCCGIGIYLNRTTISIATSGSYTKFMEQDERLSSELSPY